MKTWTCLVSLFLICALLTVPGSAAAPDASASGPLEREIASLVEQLDAVSARGGATRRGPTGFDGIAWESPDGLAAGTSALGAYLDDRVARAYAEEHTLAPPAGEVGQRGLLGTLLGGAFRPVSAGVRLTLKLIDSASGQTLSEASKVLGFELFPDAVLQNLEPPNPSRLASLGSLVESSIGRAGSAFSLRVSTDRGKHAAYKEGEQLSVYVEAERDCHVRLYLISSEDRRMTLLFPNAYSRDDSVEGGTTRRIPANPQEFAFEVAPPYGVDAIVAVASEEPFPDAELVASGWDGTDAVGGLDSEGGYLVGRGLDADRLEKVLRRGLLVRPGNADGDWPDADTPTGESGGLARASCYFATVKQLF